MDKILMDCRGCRELPEDSEKKLRCFEHLPTSILRALQHQQMLGKQKKEATRHYWCSWLGHAL